MRRALFLLLCVTACFSKPEFTGSGGGGPDANGDAVADGTADAPPGAGCMINESFDLQSEPSCGAWGTLEGNATGVRGNSRIRIAAPSGQVGFCETISSHNISGGAAIEVPIVHTGGMPGDEVFLEVNTAQGWLRLLHTQRMPETSLVPMLELVLGTSRVLQDTEPYDATMMRWWKLQSIADNQIAASYSPNGINWIDLDIVVLPNANLPTRIRFGAQGSADTGDFEVDSFSVCP